MSDAEKDSEVLHASDSEQESEASVEILTASRASSRGSPVPDLSDCTTGTHTPTSSILYKEDNVDDEGWVNVVDLESLAPVRTPSTDSNDSIPETSPEKWTEFFDAERVHDFVCFAASRDHNGNCAQGD